MTPLIALAHLPGIGVAAQEQLREDTPRWQVECRAARSVVEERAAKAEVMTSLHILLNCERSAGAAISSLWQARPTETDLIERVWYVSRRIRDGRIMAAAVEAAKDPTAFAELRLAALAVLGAYVDPTTGRINEHPDAEHLIARYTVSSTTQVSQRSGTVPLDDGYEAEVLGVLDRLAASAATDERIAGAAAALKRHLEYRLRNPRR